MKTKTKTSEDQTAYSLNRNADRLISENELLKKENARLQSERDILKKVSAGVLLWFSSARPTKGHLRIDNIILKGLFGQGNRIKIYFV